MTLVRVLISDIALRGVLRLPDDVTLVMAGTEHMPGDPPLAARTLALMLDMPAAPAGAMEAEPVYTRETGTLDPVSLTGMRWYDAEGREIKPEI